MCKFLSHSLFLRPSPCQNVPFTLATVSDSLSSVVMDRLVGLSFDFINAKLCFPVLEWKRGTCYKTALCIVLIKERVWK